MQRVQRWQIPYGHLQFGRPSVEQARHYDEAEALRLAAVEDDDAEMSVFDQSPIDVADEDIPPMWWFEDPECDGDAECTCGPVTLLEALSQLDAHERQAAIDTHLRVMRELFDHFWSGHGLTHGGSATIGDACASCLVDGVGHVWEVFEVASTLAEEFGEALCAHHSNVILGDPRFDELPGVADGGRFDSDDD